MTRDIQSDFNKSSGDLILDPNEYKGPLIIDRPCIVEGAGSTLWAPRGPVLVIAAPDVTVRNLRVEVTEKDSGADVAILVKKGSPKLLNVEVSGAVKGLPDEASVWDLPAVIHLGDFAAGEKNTFVCDITVPMNASLECHMGGVRVEPPQLRVGSNPLYIQIDSMRANTIVYGEILIKSNVVRRICLQGRAVEGADRHQAQKPAWPPVPARQTRVLEQKTAAQLGPGSRTLPEKKKHEGGPEELRVLRRGERLTIDSLIGKTLDISYTAGPLSRTLELDPYVFLLQKDGKVGRDEDFVFFHNDKSVDGGVATKTVDGKPIASVTIGKAAARIERIVVCFSIYGDKYQDTFSTQRDPCIEVATSGKQIYRFPLNSLGREKTLTALEFYRYKGGWKMQCVGGCYKGGLKALCESYGLDVE